MGTDGRRFLLRVLRVVHVQIAARSGIAPDGSAKECGGWSPFPSAAELARSSVTARLLKLTRGAACCCKRRSKQSLARPTN